MYMYAWTLNIYEHSKFEDRVYITKKSISHRYVQHTTCNVE